MTIVFKYSFEMNQSKITAILNFFFFLIIQLGIKSYLYISLIIFIKDCYHDYHLHLFPLFSLFSFRQNIIKYDSKNY